MKPQSVLHYPDCFIGDDDVLALRATIRPAARRLTVLFHDVEMCDFLRYLREHNSGLVVCLRPADGEPWTLYPVTVRRIEHRRTVGDMAVTCATFSGFARAQDVPSELIAQMDRALGIT